MYWVEHDFAFLFRREREFERAVVYAQNDDDDVVSFVRGERSFWSVNMYIGFKKMMMMMMRDFSLRRIVQNWDDSFENKKKRKWKKTQRRENERTHVEYLNVSVAAVVVAAVVFSSSVLCIGGIYCFCVILERAFALFCVACWCFLGEFLKKKSSDKNRPRP